VTGLAVPPNNSRLVVIGFQISSPVAAVIDLSPAADCEDGASAGTPSPPNGPHSFEHRMNIYDLVTKELQSYVDAFSTCCHLLSFF
jgi:hypothetical protein